jgi:GNAT superfamily N-acetyltransferase
MPLDVARVSSEDELSELLPLVRSYCDFYNVTPDDEALLAVSRALIEDPEREGIQLLARDGNSAVGFATIYWSWDTLVAARIGVMHDLFVAPSARRSGVGAALIDACLQECRGHGAAKLGWQTAGDNHAAQRLYERVGATRDEWLDYSITVEA